MSFRGCGANAHASGTHAVTIVRSHRGGRYVQTVHFSACQATAGATNVERSCSRGPYESVLSIPRLWRCGTGRGRPTGRSMLGGAVVIFNIIYAHFRTSKRESASFKLSKTHALHCRVRHLNITPPAGPRWWHTPRSQRGQSLTRSQRETSARAAAPRVGITARAARRRSRRCAALTQTPRAHKSAPLC